MFQWSYGVKRLAIGLLDEIPPPEVTKDDAQAPAASVPPGIAGSGPARRRRLTRSVRATKRERPSK